LGQRKTDSAITAQVSSLSQARRQATTAANQAYISMMSYARQQLQTSLKSTD
jgi:hypothetical protein